MVLIGIWTEGLEQRAGAVDRLTAAECGLARVAVDLGAADFGGPLSTAERRLVETVSATVATMNLDAIRRSIVAGDDPLGSWLLRIRSPSVRRRTGAFYTPPTLVEPMLDWVLSQDPDRLVDPGSGSGRFAAGAIRRN